VKFKNRKLGKYLYSINTNNSYNYELSNEVKSMCSTYVPFSLMPEDLERMAKESGMFYCRSCKKTFMMKNPSTECPHCGSIKIKPRAK
jgi:rubrerythrin